MKRLISTVTAFMMIFTLAVFLPEGALRAGAANKFSGTFFRGYYEWDEVSGAKDYRVTFESTKQSGSFTTTKPEFKPADYFTYKGYLYSFKIYARNSSGSTIAESYLDYWSDTAEITGVKLSADLTKLEWDAFEGDYEEYSINIFYPGGAGGFDVEKGVTSANLLEKMADQNRPTGTYSVNIAANLSEGYTRRMGWSEMISFEYESQNKYVSKTSVTVDLPAVGQTPADITDKNVNIVINDGKEYTSDYLRMYVLEWKRKDSGSTGFVTMKDNEVFEKDTEYRLWVIISLNNGCYMDRDIAYDKGDYSSSVNGTDARMINLSALKQYYLEYIFTPKSAIDRVDLTLTEPKAGEKPDNTAAVTKGEAKVTLVQWTENNALADTFEEGKTYNARLVLSPLEGYTFTEDTKVYFNGKQANIWALSQIIGFKGNVAYDLDFDCKGARLPGDATDDGKVNIADVIRIQQKLAGWKVKINESNSDVTGDGKVNIADVIRIQQKLAGWKVTLK